MKTIFFDWGGVVADDPGDEFLSQLLRDIGASTEQIHEIFQLYMQKFMRGEISEDEYWDELRTNYGFRINENISDEFMKWNGLVANQNILALVEEAKSKGWQTAILSNVIEPTYHVLRDAGYYDRFDAVIASCKEGVAKPEQQIYEIALQRMNTAAQDSVFIDDKKANLDPATTMGFRTILADSPDQILRDVRKLLVD